MNNSIISDTQQDNILLIAIDRLMLKFSFLISFLLVSIFQASQAKFKNLNMVFQPNFLTFHVYNLVSEKFDDKVTFNIYLSK